MANTQTNVTVGKPKANGAIYRAPYGTALPTDATTALTEAFKCLGYVSEDGFKNAPNISSQSIKAWGGDPVLNIQTGKEDQFSVKLIEVLNKEVLAAVYNASNVSGDSLDTGITVRANSEDSEAAVWVVDIIMTGNVMRRVVIPNGKISSIAEIVYKDNEAVGYDVTIAALPGSDGDTHKEYNQKVAAANG